MWFFNPNQRTSSPAPEGTAGNTAVNNAAKSPVSPSILQKKTTGFTNPSGAVSRSTTLPMPPLPGQYPLDTASNSITNSLADLSSSTVLAAHMVANSQGIQVPANEIAGRPPIASNKAGLLVTDELAEAVERCRSKVRRIADECTRLNRKYRDIDFDLLEDRERCLHGLSHTSDSVKFNPTDAVRVSQLFDNPQFFVDGATASDISQGKIGDCWFLSALAVVATAGLIERVCVEKNERVGIYGFIFWRDAGWVDVIIDDLLYLKIPRWQQLTERERMLWKHNQDAYNREARRGSKALYFSSSLTENETWVPLIEKAYAKLHGDYAALDGGFTNEGVEDLTGAVSTMMYIQDVLDPDMFWKDEIMKINTSSRLFACFTPESFIPTPMPIPTPSPTPHPGPGPSPPGPIPPLPFPLPPIIDIENPDSYNGLITSHAYSIIKAVEFRGKRFLKIRNPWGKYEWSGRWSDGSKEWTTPPPASDLPEALLVEGSSTDGIAPVTMGKKHPKGHWYGPGHVSWMDALEPLEYGFGNDGEFIMEYEDFIRTWDIIERSRLFDDTWAFSQLWLNVNCGDYPKASGWGDVSFTFTLSAPTLAVIVLAQLDTRYFYALEGPYRYSLEFAVYKEGAQVPIVTSVHNSLWDRSVKVEVNLDEGKYVVQVRLDRKLVKDKDAPIPIANLPATRKLAQKRAEQLLSASVAANFDPSEYGPRMPLNADTYTGVDLTTLEIKMHEMAVDHREMKEAAYRPRIPQSVATRSGPGSPTIRTTGAPGSRRGSIDSVTQATSVHGDGDETVAKKPDLPAVQEDNEVKIADGQTEEKREDADGPAAEAATEAPEPSKSLENGVVALNGEIVKVVGEENGVVEKAEDDEKDAASDVIQVVENPTLVVLHSDPDAYCQVETPVEAAEGTTLVLLHTNPDAYCQTEPCEQPVDGLKALPADGEVSLVALNGAEVNGLSAVPDVEDPEKTPLIRPRTPPNDSVTSPTSPIRKASDIRPPHSRQASVASTRVIPPGPIPPILSPLETNMPPMSMGMMPPGMMMMGGPPGPHSPMGPGGQGGMPPMMGGKLIHEGFHCDGCTGPIAGSRFHCMDSTCADFDLCERCFAANAHRPDHRFVEVKHPRDTAKFRENANDSAETNSVTVGLRIYTHKDCHTRIEGQLRHGHIIRQFLTMSKIV